MLLSRVEDPDPIEDRWDNGPNPREVRREEYGDPEGAVDGDGVLGK